MSWIYLAGRGANVIEGAELITVSSENPKFPKEKAYDGFPGSPFKFNYAGTDDTYDIDLTRMLNGGMENWAVPSVPDDWTDVSNGTGMLREETGVKHGGAKCLELEGNGGGNEAIAQQDKTVLSGWRMTVEAWLRGNGSNPIYAFLRCLETNELLESDGTWGSSGAFKTQTAASWSQGKVTFTVPAFSTTHRHTVTLRLRIYTTTGISYADDVALWPSVKFASVHGHNLGSNIMLRIMSDDNAAYSSPVNRGSMTIARPSFYNRIGSTIDERYWRFLAEGTNFEPIKYGELVLGQALTLTPSMRSETVTERQPRTATTGSSGQMSVVNLTEDPSREFDLDFLCLSESQKDEIRDELLLRSGYGKDPLIVVPDTDDEIVIYGRYGGAQWDYSRVGPTIKRTKVRIVEDPFSVRVA